MAFRLTSVLQFVVLALSLGAFSVSGQALKPGPNGIPQAEGAIWPGTSGGRVNGNSPVITNAPTRGQGASDAAGGGGVIRPAMSEERRTPQISAEPAEIQNEFQSMLEVSLGRPLPLFGYNLFRNVPSTFAPVDNVPVTPDYTVGPGDELLIRAWGQIDIEYRSIVDRNGTINIPRVGVINVAGIKYQDLTDYVKNAVSRNFRNFELTVTMGQLRSIQILVVGQARRPGSYTVSSLSTVVNAIFAAGGPSSRGSMRSIQLRRGNKTVTTIDLYDLLVSGDKSQDQQLLPGDVIYFPPIGALAALSGSVNNPAVFELKGATSLEQMLSWAGGLTTTAQTKAATIERILDRSVRSVERISLDPAGLKKAVRDGDLVSVLSITPRFENAVSLRGNVAYPLRYPHSPGMRVRDLIPEREALLTPDYYARRNLLVRPDIQAQQQLRTELRRQAEINWDYASIERLNPADLTTTLIPFNLGKAVLENDDQNNLVLQPGDVITIFSKEDIRVPMEKQTRFIRLEGEFSSSGVYQIQPGETLRQLVARVGGLARNAYLFGAEFTRESTRQQQQRSLDEAINRLETDIQRAGSTRAQNTINAEDANALKQQVEAQRSMVERLRQVRATGRIVLATVEEASVMDLPDLALEDGDRFLVPSRPSTVQVVGAVFNPSSYIYRPGRRTTDYLAEAGGPTRDADRSSIYVLRADGSVISARQSGWLFSGLDGKFLMPGDSVVVPEELEKTSFMRNLKDIAQIFYQFGLGAAAIKVIKN
jgi:polysaccharide export outer membrane protein